MEKITPLQQILLPLAPYITQSVAIQNTARTHTHTHQQQQHLRTASLSTI